MLKLDPGSDLFPHRWAASDFKLLYLAQSAISLHTSVENIWDFNKKVSRSGSKYDSKIDSRYSFNIGLSFVVKPGHSIFWLFQLTTNPRKNIDKTILCCHKSSEQLSETLSQRSTIPSWSWLLRWRPLSFQSWYQSHDRKVSAALSLVNCDNADLLLVKKV